MENGRGSAAHVAANESTQVHPLAPGTSSTMSQRDLLLASVVSPPRPKPRRSNLAACIAQVGGTLTVVMGTLIFVSLRYYRAYKLSRAEYVRPAGGVRPVHLGGTCGVVAGLPHYRYESWSREERQSFEVM